MVASAEPLVENKHAEALAASPDKLTVDNSVSNRNAS
jgi:hypothetical protein